MLEFTLWGNDYFDGVSQPVLLVQAQKIKYFNPAAKALFAQAGISLSPDAPLPELLPRLDSGTASLRLNAGQWTVLVRPLAEGALYQLIPVRENSEEDLLQLRQLSMQLQLLLSHTGMAAEALQTELSETEQLRSSSRIASLNRNLHQLLRLSDHLDFYTRSSDDLLTLFPPCIVELNAFCRELELLIQPVSRQISRSFVLEGCPGALNALVSSHLLRKVLYNLISNALRSGGDLHLRLRSHGSTALLTLTDTGTGISPARMETLFTLDASSPEDGLSLGLPLCRRILQLYGGQLVISSTSGGTAVSLSLPLCETGQEHLCDNPPVLPKTGYNLLLIELSDVLPDHLYTQEDIL